jgi:hypothetical protein
MKTATPHPAPAPVRATAPRTPRAPRATRKTAPKVAATPAVKTAARPVTPASRKAAAAAKSAAITEQVSATPTAPAAADKPPKPPKVRLVRDSFTMPETDFALVAVLKARALGLGRAAKKSELLRAGLQLLSQQDAPGLLVALERLQPIKTGRPKRGD